MTLERLQKANDLASTIEDKAYQLHKLEQMISEFKELGQKHFLIVNPNPLSLDANKSEIPVTLEVLKMLSEMAGIMGKEVDTLKIEFANL